MRNVILLLVAFLSGAILMALEIVGGRVLMQYFGGSIYVWGSLIGVFLAALSVGYYLAGKLSDRHPNPWLLAVLLFLAGVLVTLLPQYGWGLCDRISLTEIGDRAGPLLAATLLFFLPAVLMGSTSPFVIRLTAERIEQIGQTAGAVYAVSTVGSIAGTLGTAFYLLGWLGVRNITYLLGALLIATSLLPLLRWRKLSACGPLAVTLAVLAVGFAGLGTCATAEARERILLERDSPYHHLYVTEDQTYRWLRADTVWHTQMLLSDPHGRGLPYTDYIDLAFLFNPDIHSVLVIGLGGGTIPKRFVRDYPQVTVHAVEVDADVVKIAAQYFDVHPGPRLKVFTDDGRRFLRRSQNKYDLIVLDAYYADTVPFFLTTKEFFTIAKSHLAPGGVFVNNTIGTVSGSRSKFFRSVYRTMKEVFPQVYPIAVPESGTVMNIEIFAQEAGPWGRSSTPALLEGLKARARQMQNKAIKDPDLVAKVNNLITTPIRTNDMPTLSDDYAPVDQLLHLW
jgi:spermidine synthase